MLLWLSLPAVLSALGFGLCLLAVACAACALAVGVVEFVSAFCDGHDVVGFVDLAGASWAVDLAVLVARLYGSFPCGLLCAGCGAACWVVGPVHLRSPSRHVYY